MGAILRRYPFLLVLAALAVALAAIVAWEVTAHVGSGAPLGSRAVRRAAPFEAKLMPPPQIVQAEQQYPEFAARPLWTPTRRPAPAAAAPSTYTPGQFVLQGVIIAAGTRTAMLREKSSGKVHRVEMGREVNGIKVASIERDTVTLAQGGESEVVPMQVQKGAAAAGQPHVAGPFAQPAAPGQPPQAVPPPVAQAAPQQPPPVQIPAASAALLGIAPPQQGAPANAPEVTTPMSPEELLARRRARRAQPNQ